MLLYIVHADGVFFRSSACARKNPRLCGILAAVSPEGSIDSEQFKVSTDRVSEDLQRGSIMRVNKGNICDGDNSLVGTEELVQVLGAASWQTAPFVWAGSVFAYLVVSGKRCI